MNYRSLFVISSAIAWLGSSSLLATDDPAAPRIEHEMCVGTWSPPPPPEPLPERSVISEVEYVLPAEGRSIIVQEVVPPEEPPPPPPPPEPTADQIAASEARRAERLKSYQAPRCLFFSCTVYDFKATRVSWSHKGSRYTAWSAIDWTDFCGLRAFTAGEPAVRHAVFLGVGNIDTTKSFRPGRPPIVPLGIPELPSDGPGFVVTEGDATNTEALRDLQAMHDLYKTDGPRLREARLAREQAARDREAWLLANPPQPRDTIIQFGRKGPKP